MDHPASRPEPPAPGPGDLPALAPEHRQLLLDLAWASLRHGCAHGRPATVDLETLPPDLAAPWATFVTLTRAGDLRGCCGHLEACLPLARDVAGNAFASAFRDPRFPPLAAGELEGLEVEISVLAPAEPVPFATEADLLARIRPGEDGLILRDRTRLGTFLPAMWAVYPDPRDFLRQLRAKAGLPPRHDLGAMEVLRYRALTIR